MVSTKHQAPLEHILDILNRACKVLFKLVLGHRRARLLAISVGVTCEEECAFKRVLTAHREFERRRKREMWLHFKGQN